MARFETKLRSLFVSISQSPRPDLLDAVTEGVTLPAQLSEIGLLDGMGGSEINALLAAPDETAVAARLAVTVAARDHESGA